MSVAQTTACQNLATQLIHDRKLEIQENAARTLAGMLKGLTPEAFVELKDSLYNLLTLAIPVEDRLFRVEANSSNFATGAILL